MAVVFAALLILIVAPPAALDPGDSRPGVVSAAGAQAIGDTAASKPQESVREAAGTIRGLWRGFQRMLPKIMIALGVLAVAWLLLLLFRPVLRVALRSYSRAEAVRALLGVAIWILAIGVALSILAGDVRTLIGSLGLIGLALSWALQTPIESFAGWFINSFKSYYRVGDRIAVGDVFGDVYRIDLLTTTVWEAGAPGKAVQAAQPTGALITFPNSEVLRANIVNYTRDFPYVWDEVNFGVANESDLPYAVGVARRVAADVVGGAMSGPAGQYRQLLLRVSLAWDVAVEPQVYLSLTDAWTQLTIRYLVPARERRMWSSRLIEVMAGEFAKPEHAAKIIGGYPRTNVQLLDDGERLAEPRS